MGHGRYSHLSGRWYIGENLAVNPGDQTVCDTELHVNMYGGVFIYEESGGLNDGDGRQTDIKTECQSPERSC